MPERLGVAVIGCGMAAKPHARALQDLSDRINVIGVHGRNPARRADFCTQWGFTEAPNAAALLDDPRVGMALILTPPDARERWVAAATQRQLPVLMEKPIERTTEAAESLVALCEATKTPLGIVFQHRFRAAARRLRSLVQSGELGALRVARADVPWWREQAYYDEPGRGTYARDGGGVLISQAIHTLDLLLSLTGPVDEVRALSATSAFHTMESEDFVVAGLRFANSALGSVTATTALYPGGSESIELGFEHASARLCAGELTVHHRTGDVESLGEPATTGGGADPMAFPHDWHLSLIGDFVEAVQTGRPPAVTGREALQVHRLIDAISDAARTGAPTHLPRQP